MNVCMNMNMNINIFHILNDSSQSNGFESISQED